MRLLLLIIFLSMVVPGKILPGWQPALNVTTFTGDKIPDQLQGCGDGYYPTAVHRKKHDIFICCVNDANAMICVNNHTIVLTKSFQFDRYELQGYTFSVKIGPKKQMDS